MNATAKSITIYYAAEKAFVTEPSSETVRAYLAAADRFHTLRDQLRSAYAAAEALQVAEKDESAER